MFAKEEELNTTINNLERRLFQSESKNDEMLCSSQDAMTPLLLQITNLETQYRLTSTDWKSTEQNLLQRCQIAEKESSLKDQKLKNLTENLEDQVKLHNEYLSSVESNDQQILNLTMKIKDLEAAKTKLEQEVEHYKSENQYLEKIKEENLSQLSLSHEVISFNQNSIQELKKEYREKIESQIRRSIDTKPTSSPDLANVEMRNSLQHMNISQQTKVFKSQILTLESQLEHLEQTRDELTSEIILLQTQNERLQTVCKEHEKCGELEERYGTVLELLGEKEEKVLELENDILDIKMAYKEQMENQFK
jgi:outer membrane murein-binding lipoprotein Lpp